MDPKSSSVPTKRAWYQNKIVVSVLALVVLLGAGVGYFSQSSDLFKGSLFVNGERQNLCNLSYDVTQAVINSSVFGQVAAPASSRDCRFTDYEIIADSKPNAFGITIDRESGVISKTTSNNDNWELFPQGLGSTRTKIREELDSKTKTIRVRARNAEGRFSETTLKITQSKTVPNSTRQIGQAVDYPTVASYVPGGGPLPDRQVTNKSTLKPVIFAEAGTDVPSNTYTNYLAYPPLPNGLRFSTGINEPGLPGEIVGQIPAGTKPACSIHNIYGLIEGLNRTNRFDEGRFVPIVTKVIGQSKIKICITEGEPPSLGSIKNNVSAQNGTYHLKTTVFDQVGLQDVSYRLNSNPSVRLINSTDQRAILAGDKVINEVEIDAVLEIPLGKSKLLIFAKDVDGNTVMETINIQGPVAKIKTKELFNKNFKLNPSINTPSNTPSSVEESVQRQDLTPNSSLQKVFGN